MNWLSIAATVWGVLAVVAVALFFYHARTRERLNDTVTFVEGDLQTEKRVALEKKVELMKRWVKNLIGLVVVYGVALFLCWLYVITFGEPSGFTI